ncbi:MAG TPA: GPR endopeptidase [Clostridia bacterium]|nr:GPR endopeptidase [Clostridia bacterium]
MSVYTDLAMEARELHPELSGVCEECTERPGIAISRIKVETEEAAKEIGKAMGTYVTLDAPGLVDRPLDLFEELSKALSDELKALLSNLPKTATVLVVGLGNRSITPDSLGPAVAEQVFVTRHIHELLPDAIPATVRSVCSAAPGVLGVTGIETMEVVRGITEHVKPDLIIAIDSLASRRAARISTTLQLTDAGISPGSGVGNTRAGLNKDTFGVPVIAIGVPLVVYASTISQDTISLIAEETGLHKDEERLKELAEKVISEKIGTLIVTPKDIDTIVKDMARILADGINLALFDASYDEIRMLVA